MTEDQKKGIRASRPSNIARVLASLLLVYLYWTNPIPYPIIPLLHLFPSFVWWIWIEYWYPTYEKYPGLWYIAALLDIFMPSTKLNHTTRSMEFTYCYRF